MTCNRTLAQCRCVLTDNHDGPHACGETTGGDFACQGSWEGDGDDIRIVRYPTGDTSPLAGLLSMLDSLEMEDW